MVIICFCFRQLSKILKILVPGWFTAEVSTIINNYVHNMLKYLIFEQNVHLCTVLLIEKVDL